MDGWRDGWRLGGRLSGWDMEQMKMKNTGRENSFRILSITDRIPEVIVKEKRIISI